MAFSITAEFPLGTYRGHRPDQSQERVPSVARLQAALLGAAGFGPRAQFRDDGWGPNEEDRRALRWLEEHPPDSVSVPRLEVSRNDAVAYRDDGTLTKDKARLKVRKLRKQDAAVAVAGAFVWSWDESPPEPIVTALRSLCPDVPHLGTTESPVRLVADADADGPVPTHRRNPGSALFGSGPNEELELPTSGRVDEMVDAFRVERGAKPGIGRVGSDERSTSPVPPRTAVRSARYGATAHQTTDVPWPEVLLVPLRVSTGSGADVRLRERDKVRWALAAHRALIRILDRSSPPVLTGAYPDAARRPPNRVALHLLTCDQPVDMPSGATTALAILIPREADLAELSSVYEGVGRLRNLRTSHGVAEVSGSVEVRPGDLFWREPAPNQVRLWRTSPAAVPDTRGRAGWTFTHAALLSVGFVWQGTPALPALGGRGAERDAAVVEAVNAAGAVVLDADPLRTSRVDDYVHRVHPDAVVRPYRALLHLGDLAGARTIQALGQARHLGGGLLVPEDRSADALVGRMS